jgi:hypothetical protein
MKGRHHIVLETANLKYEFDIKRNITVIQGDSATGKTTLIDIMDEYVRRGSNRGIRLQSDVPCEVYVGTEERWKYELEGMQGSIVFFDEDYRFIYSHEFAEYIQTADNYFVFITRKPLKNLPYSINEIYGIKTSGKYHFPEQVYHEFYPIYRDQSNGHGNQAELMVLIEDKESGYQFFNKVLSAVNVVSAEGNSKIQAKMIETDGESSLLIIADGAALGPYIDGIVKYAGFRKSVALYFPESFEWMILKSGVLEDRGIDEILSHPEDYIDSREYISWERFFTALLRECTVDDRYKQYNKSDIPEFYTQGKNADRILSVMPEEIRELL